MLKLIGRTLNDFYVLVMIIFLLFNFLSIPYVFAVLEFFITEETRWMIEIIFDESAEQLRRPLVASDNLLGLVFCE